MRTPLDTLLELGDFEHSEQLLSEIKVAQKAVDAVCDENRPRWRVTLDVEGAPGSVIRVVLNSSDYDRPRLVADDGTARSEEEMEKIHAEAITSVVVPIIGEEIANLAHRAFWAGVAKPEQVGRTVVDEYLAMRLEDMLGA